MKKRCTLLTSNYDLAGNGIIRTLLLCQLARILPMGNLSGGGGFRPLITLAVLHVCGRRMFFVLIRYEKYLNSLYKVLKRDHHH